MATDYKDYPISAVESFSDIEEKMAELIQDKAYKVRFTSTLDTNGALGIEAAMLQLIGTWIRQNKYTKVFHSYQLNQPEDFKRLCGAIYGIAALSLIDEVWDVTGKKLKRGLVLDSAKENVAALRRKDFSKSFKSKYLGVPYIKTPTYDREFEMLFYNNSEVIEADAFYRLFERILEEKIAGRSRFKNLKEIIDIEDLSDMLWELFKNTHDHGREFVSGDFIQTNFRSILIQQPDLEIQYFDKWLGESPSKSQIAFADYWKNKKLDRYPFLDLSVVDFGSGFVDLAKKKSGLKGESEILLKCLEPGWSRLPERSRGDGLTKVINAVKKHKGWLRIRTGKFLIEKTFDSYGNNLSIEDVTEMPTSVTGTSFHVSFFLEGYQKGGLQ